MLSHTPIPLTVSKTKMSARYGPGRMAPSLWEPGSHGRQGLSASWRCRYDSACMVAAPKRQLTHEAVALGRTDKSSAQLSIWLPSPNQLLHGAARRFTRLATTTELDRRNGNTLELETWARPLSFSPLLWWVSATLCKATRYSGFQPEDVCVLWL